MRPHKVNANGILAPDMECVLIVKRDDMTNRWRLAWFTPFSTAYLYAEGGCSAKLFQRQWQAIAYGVRAYGETAMTESKFVETLCPFTGWEISDANCP